MWQSSSVCNNKKNEDFPGPMVESLPASSGDVGSIPGLGTFHVPQGN